MYVSDLNTDINDNDREHNFVEDLDKRKNIQKNLQKYKIVKYMKIHLKVNIN